MYSKIQSLVLKKIVRVTNSSPLDSSRVLLGVKDKVEVEDIDIRNYAKFILKDGTSLEKRELLGCLKSKIVLKEKIITAEK